QELLDIWKALVNHNTIDVRREAAARVVEVMRQVSEELCARADKAGTQEELKLLIAKLVSLAGTPAFIAGSEGGNGGGGDPAGPSRVVFMAFRCMATLAEPVALVEGEQGLLDLMRQLRDRVAAATGIFADAAIPADGGVATTAAGSGTCFDASAVWYIHDIGLGGDCSAGGKTRHDALRERLEACGVVLSAVAAVASRMRVLDDATG
ncbi:hypothetical protein Agub_g6691, partial [Astrephomene gubernaculifera]